jgi:hypothetical protein
MATTPVPPDANQVNEREIIQVQRMVDKHNASEIELYNARFDQWLLDYNWKTDQGRTDYPEPPRPGMAAELYFKDNDREKPEMRLTDRPVGPQRSVPAPRSFVRSLPFSSLFVAPTPAPTPTAASTQTPHLCPVCEKTGLVNGQTCRACGGTLLVWR